MSQSLRVRLLVGIAAAITLTFTIAMGTLYVETRRSFVAEFDETLSAKARALAALTEQSDTGIQAEFNEHPMHEFARKVRPEYYQLRTDDGVTVVRSRWLRDNDLPIASGSLNSPQGSGVVLPDGRRGRMVSLHFAPRRAGDDTTLPEPDHVDDDDDDDHAHEPFLPRLRVSLVVAAGTDELDAAIASQGRLMLGVSSVSLITLLGGLALFVSRSLHPLNQLAEQIQRVDEESLREPLGVSDAPSEILPVITRLNELMQRLHEAFNREKTFSSDIAHELRTPIAGLRSTLEVSLRRERRAREYRESMEECFAICDGTQRVVEALLSMSRVEAGREILEKRLVDPSRLLRRVWKTFRAAAAQRDLVIDWQLADGVLVNSDPEMLAVVFTNLFDNAVSYADSGKIEVRAVVADGEFEITVSNSCRDLNHHEIGHVFDRFWRADSARAATGSHSGLGLALCQRISVGLGLTIRARGADSIFSITMIFPATEVELAVGQNGCGDVEVVAASEARMSVELELD